MMAWVRFLVSGIGLTTWYSLQVIWAAVNRVPNDPDGVYDRIPRDWARALIEINQIGVAVEGLELMPAATACVFAANHLSLVDILVLLDVLPGRLRFMAKRELSYYPLLGTALRAARHILIDRQDLTRAVEAYREAAEVVQSGMSAVVFVEGTRSRDGRLMEFKKGAFVLAIAAGVPIVPVRIDGTFQMLPAGSLAFRPGQARIRIGPPLSTEGLSYDDRDALVARCRAEIVRLEVA